MDHTTSFADAYTDAPRAIDWCAHTRGRGDWLWDERPVTASANAPTPWGGTTMTMTATARPPNGTRRHEIDVNGRHTLTTGHPEKLGGSDTGRQDEPNQTGNGARYTIAGGLAGKKRLDLLARICATGTKALFDKAGIPAGARCLDVGCGGGHVSCELALRVGGAGSVVGIDLDEVVLELARADAIARGITNVTFRRGDATRLDAFSFDVVFARFLLSHVSDPRSAIRAFVRALKPGGLMVVEDIDMAGTICHPPSAAHDRSIELYRETVRRRGGNADIGPALPAALVDARLDTVGIQVSQQLALTGETKLIIPLTLVRIADAVVAEGVASLDSHVGRLK